MKSRLLIRFSFVLVGGVILVWIFGVDSDEGLLGTKNERVKVSEEEARQAAKGRRNPDSDVAVSGALIPVREELSDRPGVSVRKYTVRIGYTASGASRKMHAEDVSVDIYNKKTPPEELLIARVHGDEAWINFQSAPDAANGFKDAEIDSMTLMQNVVVEYLNADGDSVSELHSETLDLSDQRFYVEGRAVITQEGMRVEGDGLTYLKDGGSFTLERNVKVEGTKFGLPATDSKDELGVVAPGAVSDAVATFKTITCDGKFTFVPEEEPAVGTGDESEPDFGQMAKLGGGLLTFRDNVVASQDESSVACDQLEITLKSLPPAEPGGKKKLQVTHVVATGSPTRKATMTDPKGTLMGETVTLVETEAGQVITLNGEPRIKDAHMGDTVFSAGARDQIRFRPVKVEGVEADTILLELIENAYLQTEGGAEGGDFRIEGKKFDLEFAKLPAEPGAAESGASQGSLDLRQLLATGSPQVLMNSVSKDGVATLVTIRSLSGDLVYTPPKSKDEQTQAVFNGATLLTVAEAAQVTTTLKSSDRLTILMDSPGTEGGGGPSSLVAEGTVDFENSAQHVRGTGEKMTLFPSGDGKYRLSLAGTPDHLASATKGGPDEEAKVISGLQIDFDPETGALVAERQVEARLAGLDFASGFGSGKTPEDPADSQAVLRCEKLTVRPEGEDGTAVIEAEGSVVFDDPDQAIRANCYRLYYKETEGLARLFGNDLRPATLTRYAPGQQTDGPPQEVSISGPLLLLEKATGRLTCAERGTVVLLRPAADENGKAQKIAGRSRGPIRYFEDRLVLHQEVVIAFEEDQTETRAVWCDVATVFFSEKQADPERASGNNSTAGGLDRIEAVGRVHLEQSAPKDLMGEGQKLVWILGSNDEVMTLSGTNPQCWVVGLLGDKNVRDEADWFRLDMKSNEVLAENGRTVLLKDASQR